MEKSYLVLLLLAVVIGTASAQSVVQLTKNSADDIHPDWSPDGSKIVFASNRSGNYDIYVMNSDGSGLKKLTNDPLDEVFPSWSNDGKRIVYVKGYFYGGDWFWQSDVNNGEIWIMDSDGSNKRNVTDGIASPVFSPSDNEIVFVGGNLLRIYKYNLNTHSKINITPQFYLKTGGGIFRLSWHGNRIAYDAYPFGIQTFDSNGNNFEQIYEAEDGPVNPDWSPDGNRIAYSNNTWKNGYVNNIEIIDLATKKVVVLENTSSIDSWPSWSPDGKKIAFVSNRNGNNDIWIANLNSGSDERKTTSIKKDVESNCSCTNIPLTADAWMQELHRQGAYKSTFKGLLVKGGAWTNGRLTNGRVDGNYLLSNQSFDFTKGGDIYFAFIAHGDGYMSIYAPGLTEVTDTIFIHTGNNTTDIKVPWLTTHYSWMNSIVIPDDEILFMHLRLQSNRIYHWSICKNDYDNHGGKIIAQYSGIVSKEHWQYFKNAKIPIYFLDNYANEKAYLLIKEVKVCTGLKGEPLEFNWSWSDPNTNDYFSINRNKIYLRVNPYQNIWWCDRGTAPLLTTEVPKSNKWSTEVKLSLAKREPSTHIGLVIWDGREQSPVHALYVGLYDVDRIRVEGSYSGTCTGWSDTLKSIENNTGTFDDIYKQKEVFLKIEKDKQSYAFYYRSSNFERWKMLGCVNTTDNFTQIGVVGKSWGWSGIEANFSNFNIAVDDFTLATTQRIGVNGGKIATKDIEAIIPESALSSTHVIKLYERNPYSYENYTISKVFRIEGFPVTYSKPITLKVKFKEGYEKGKKIHLKIAYGGFVYDCKGTCEIHDFFEGNSSNSYFVVQLPCIESGEIRKNNFSMMSISNTSYSRLNFGLLDIIKRITESSKQRIIETSMELFGPCNVTKNKHFKIYYPRGTSKEKIEKIGNYLEDAYGKFLSLGFSYNKRTSWPMHVYIEDLGEDAYGYYSNSIWGNNHGYIQINSEKINNLKEMKTTIGHEFFHFVQSLYDPRGSYTKAKCFSKHAWLDEACAVWSEAMFSDNPNYVSKVYDGNEDEPLSGISRGLSKETYQGYGYGMSAVIKYLVKKKGRGVVLDLYKQIESGKGSVEALLNIAGSPEEWYSDFLKEHIASNAISAFNPEIVKITGNGKITRSSGYPDLSAKIYRIFFKAKELNDKSSITFSIDWPGKVMVLKMKSNREKEWIGPSAKITIDNLKSLIDNGYKLFVVVVNDLCLPPYDTNTKITLKMNVKLTNKTKKEGVGVRIENLKITKTDKDFVVNGTVIGTNLNPDKQICEFDDVYIIADIKENSSSKYPELPEFYSIGWGCDVKGGKCLTKEEAEGIGITKYIISQFSLRPRWVWKNYGGLGKWRENAPSTVKMNFSGTIPLEYEGKTVRIRAKLVHAWGGPYANWPAMSYHHCIAYDGELKGNISVATSLSP